MTLWSGKSQGNVLGYKIFIWMIRYTGLGAAYFLLRFVSFYFFLFSFKSSSNLFFYFRYILRFSWLKAIVSVYRNYFAFGQTLLDKVAVLSGNGALFTYTFEGGELLNGTIKNSTKGVLLISAHAGNWEVAGHALKNISKKVNIVLFDGEHEKIKKYLGTVEKDSHYKLIVVNKDRLDHIYQINEALVNNELVCIHGDRFVEGSKTFQASFMNHEAAFPAGPFLLAGQLEVPVLFVYAMKERKYHYRFFASEPQVSSFSMDRKERNKEATKLLMQYIESLEKIIRRYPIQWYNYYQFWIIKK